MDSWWQNRVIVEDSYGDDLWLYLNEDAKQVNLEINIDLSQEDPILAFKDPKQLTEIISALVDLRERLIKIQG